ncbi:glutathione S-transferase Mu 4-like [Corticium candelabrum]|uniref:glutathione S-transferase Mu 4-like n=1 Tax=Corticium candelabrum TaxID=121492 RepID=UPI002E25AFEC|nr:glutathione S-transferase Mu 4-like [Corticium candelabrum]
MPMKLGYWKVRGLAQPIRLMLTYTGEEFEDTRYEKLTAETAAEWLDKDKKTLGLAFPNLPYLIDGDVKVTQSNAILRYLGRKHDMCGKTPNEQLRVDICASQVMDMRNAFIALSYNKTGASRDKWEELKTEYISKLPATLKLFSDFLGDQKWLAGNNLTFPDFHFYEMLSQHSVVFPGCLDGFPALQSYVARFEDLPAIKAYRASSSFLDRPVNNHAALLK